MADKTKILSADSMAILIDCWEHLKVECLDTIATRCATDPTIKAVALSTYIPKLRSYFPPVERQWYPRTKKLFYDNVPWQALIDIWDESTDHVMTKSWTHESIRNMTPVAGQTRFLAQQSLYLLYYLNVINPAIKNIYFFGGAWEQCLKWRSTGWREIAYLIHVGLMRKDINLLVRSDCIYGAHGTAKPMFNDQWSAINKEVYRLDISRVDFTEKQSNLDVVLPFDYRKER